MKKKKIDKIFIGSSPISCLDAISDKLSGKSVMIIEKEKFIGGSWGNLKIQSNEVDIGCHIWSLDYKVYNFISNFLKIKLIQMRPQPVIRIKNLSFKYYFKNILLVIKYFLYNKILNIKSENFSNLKYYHNFNLRKKYLIPKYGFKSFINSIKRKLYKYQINLKLNNEVNSVTIKNKYLIVSLKNKKKIYCRSINITSNTIINSLLLENKKNFFPEIKKKIFTHAHIVLNQNKSKNSYIRIVGDNLIKRLSFYYNQKNNKSFIIVSLRHNKIRSNLIKTKLINKIIKLGYIKDKKNIIQIYINSFRQNSLTKNSILKILELTKNRISYSNSSDLIFGMSRKINNWSKKNMINERNT